MPTVEVWICIGDWWLPCLSGETIAFCPSRHSRVLHGGGDSIQDPAKPRICCDRQLLCSRVRLIGVTGERLGGVRGRTSLLDLPFLPYCSLPLLEEPTLKASPPPLSSVQGGGAPSVSRGPGVAALPGSLATQRLRGPQDHVCGLLEGVRKGQTLRGLW